MKKFIFLILYTIALFLIFYFLTINTVKINVVNEHFIVLDFYGFESNYYVEQEENIVIYNFTIFSFYIWSIFLWKIKFLIFLNLGIDKLINLWYNVIIIKKE